MVRQKKDRRKGTWKLSFVSPVPPHKGKRILTKKTWIKKETAERDASDANRSSPRLRRRVVKIRR